MSVSRTIGYLTSRMFIQRTFSCRKVSFMVSKTARLSTSSSSQANEHSYKPLRIGVQGAPFDRGQVDTDSVTFDTLIRVW
jgi:hypothetical protein